MTVQSQSARSEPTETVALPDFFTRLAESNPFLSGQVSDPRGVAADVTAIHDAPFRDLVRAAQSARSERTGVGVVLWGEAGIGKSHLLARLCGWAEQENESGRRRALYMFLHNIQTAPERLARYVLKCAISRLTSGRTRAFHGTPLYWLVTESLKKALEDFPIAGKLPSADEARGALLRMADRMTARNQNLGADARNVFEVLFRFYLGAYKLQQLDGDEREARLAVRWLSGEELEPEETACLGLTAAGEGADRSGGLPDDQAIQTVLVVLTELAANRGQCFLLCFDQVDNLNDDQIRALTQFQHTLIDHARNLLVVTSGVKSKLLELQQSGTVLTAAWARIAQQELTLSRISPTQARQILETRLESWLEPFLNVEEINRHIHADPLFPLGASWLQGRLGDLVELRPRDAINWARDGWRRQQRRLEEAGAATWLRQWPGDHPVAVPEPGREVRELSPAELLRAIDEKVESKIREQIARHEQDPSALPPDAGNLAGLAEVLLRQVAAAHDSAGSLSETEESDVESYVPTEIQRFPARPRKPLPVYDLVVRLRDRAGSEWTAGVAIPLTGNARSTAFALRRLAFDSEPPDCVLLVTEQRRPLRLGARGSEYLDRLASRGPQRFRQIELTFAEYAELDALSAVAGDARSGDIELDLPGGHTRLLTEAEVVASHVRRGRFRWHPLLGALLASRGSLNSSPPSPS